MSRKIIFALTISLFSFSVATAEDLPRTTTTALTILSAIDNAEAKEFSNKEDPKSIKADPVYLKNEFTTLLGAILAVEEVVGYGEIKIHSTECHVKDVDLNVSPFVCTAGITYNDGKAAIGYRFETSQDKIEAKNITVTYFTKK